MADMTRTVNPGGGADHTSINAAIAYIVANWTPTGSDKAYVDVTGNDTTAIAVTGAPTGQTSDNIITVRPASGQGHAGLYNTGKARVTLAPSYQVGMVRVTGAPALFLKFEHMQFENTATSGNVPVVFDVALGAGLFWADECLVRFTGAGMPTYPGDDTAVLLNRSATNSAVLRVRNCIGWNGSASYFKYGYSATPGTIEMQNNTWYGFSNAGGSAVVDRGGNHDGGSFDVRNTFAHVTAGLAYLAAGSGTLLTTGLATSDTSCPNAGLRSLTPSFVNAGSFDFHLQSGDTALKDQGTDIAGTFANDIDGGSFGVRNDIGADEYAAAGGGSAPMFRGS